MSNIPRHFSLSFSQFWRLKLTEPPKYDIVLAGSSRVYRGLSPRHMGLAGGEYRIFNFGFPSCSMQRPYLEHARNLLDDRSQRPTLVLGLSPHTLMRRASLRKNGYMYWAQEGPLDRQKLLRQIRRNNLTGLATLRAAVAAARELKEHQALERYFPTGWVATLPIRSNPLDYVKRLERVFERWQVDEGVVEEMLSAVRDFSNQGVTVYGFRPPTNPHMRRLEDQHSGFNHSQLAQRFCSAGGRWLHINERPFFAYDGSHLGFKTAIRFSHYLAGLLGRG